MLNRLAYVCSKPECGNKHYAKGYCSKHYRVAKYTEMSLPGTPCSMEKCQNNAYTWGYCEKHYAVAKRSGEFSNKICLFPECSKTSADLKKDYCQSHIDQLHRSGKMSPLRKFTNGDWCNWSKNSHGYMVRSKEVDGKRYNQSQHRYVMEQHLGRPLVKSENVHHKNGVRDDNRIENLELWSTSQPRGQRVADKIAWAREILDKYEKESPLL